jgi:hypothetical protein
MEQQLTGAHVTRKEDALNETRMLMAKHAER